MTTNTEFWDRKYNRNGFVYGRRPNEFLVDHLPGDLSAGDSIVSPGEGEGRNAVWLAEQGFETTAVDCSQPAISKLENLADRRGVDVTACCRDVTDFNFGTDCWDAVVLMHLHLPPDTRRRIHRRLVFSLRPGGYLLLEALRPAQRHQLTARTGTPDHFYTADELRRDFRDLHLQKLRQFDRLVFAGEHRGPTSVVQLVARHPDELS